MCLDLMKLFSYIGPTLTGILPYAGLKFYIYEEIKTRVPEEHRKSIVMNLSCGALAGLLGQTFTYPLDVVRRQMQVLYNTNCYFLGSVMAILYFVKKLAFCCLVHVLLLAWNPFWDVLNVLRYMCTVLSTLCVCVCENNLVK